MDTEKQGVMSKTWFCVLMLFVFFPLGLYCMWHYKKFSKTVRIIVTVVLALMVISAVLGDNSGTTVESGNQEMEQPEKTYPDFVVDEFDKAIYDLAEENNGELTSITKEGNEDKDTLVTISYANDEEKVNALVEKLKPIVANEGTNLIVSISDENSDEDLILVNIKINTKGNTKVISQNPDYMTAYKKWYDERVVGNHHVAFETMIEDAVNDPDSFEHGNTICIPMTDKEILNEKNQLLKEDGYDVQLEMNDILILCEYRASNAFGGIIKNTAIGINRYSDDTMLIVDNLPGWIE